MTTTFTMSQYGNKDRIIKAMQEHIDALEAQLASPHPLHQHLLHMLGAKSHEEAGAIIAQLHAAKLAAPQPMHARVIAGAIYDFAGYLTTLPEAKAIHCSEVHEAAPMVDAVTVWSTKRGLSLDGAYVTGWRAQLAAVQQGVQQEKPFAVLTREIGESSWWDHKPVKPDSVQHMHAKRDPHYDYVELYTHPTQQGLLEALESMVDVCEGHDFDGAPSDAHMEKARSAIAAHYAAQAKQGGE